MLPNRKMLKCNRIGKVSSGWENALKIRELAHRQLERERVFQGPIDFLGFVVTWKLT